VKKGSGHGSRSLGMKALKLPPFNEEKDDLDAYPTRFERACVAFEVSQVHCKSTVHLHSAICRMAQMW